MADLSNMSDAELLELLGDAEPESTDSPISSLSDDELLGILGSTSETPLEEADEGVEDVSGDIETSDGPGISLTSFADSILRHDNKRTKFRKLNKGETELLRVAGKEGLPNAISVGQTAASLVFPGAGLATQAARLLGVEFFGQAMKAVIRGKDNETAAMEGLKAVGIDVSLSTLLKGLNPKVVRSLSKSFAKDKRGAKIASKKLGEVSTQGVFRKLLRLEARGGKLNDIVVDKFLKNPGLIDLPQQSAVSLHNRAFKGITNIRNSLGAQVGEAKRLARASKEVVNDTAIINGVDSALRKFKAGKKLVPKVDTPGKRALDVVQKELKRKSKKSLTDAFQILENIDSSPAFRKIYKSQADGLALTEGQAAALRFRGRINDMVNNKTVDVLEKQAPQLLGSKKEFIEVANAMDIIKRSGISKQNIGKLLTSSTQRDNEEILKAFITLDNKSQIKFLDKVLAREVSDTLLSASSQKSFLRILTNAVSKYATDPKTFLNSAGRAAKRGAIEILEDNSVEGDALRRNTLR